MGIEGVGGFRLYLNGGEFMENDLVAHADGPPFHFLFLLLQNHREGILEPLKPHLVLLGKSVVHPE